MKFVKKSLVVFVCLGFILSIKADCPDASIYITSKKFPTGLLFTSFDTECIDYKSIVAPRFVKDSKEERNFFIACKKAKFDPVDLLPKKPTIGMKYYGVFKGCKPYSYDVLKGKVKGLCQQYKVKSGTYWSYWMPKGGISGWAGTKKFSWDGKTVKWTK